VLSSKKTEGSSTGIGLQTVDPGFLPNGIEGDEIIPSMVENNIAALAAICCP
jgi:hypothetical protein